MAKMIPSFIKIDVEGSERAVLEGAIQTLNKYTPIVLLEYWPRKHDPLLLLKQLGYEFWDSNIYKKVTPDDYRQLGWGNVLAVPPRLTGTLSYHCGEPIISKGCVFRVGAGRSVVAVSLRSANNEYTGCLCLRSEDGRLWGMVCGDAGDLAHHSNRFVIDCVQTLELKATFQSAQGKDVNGGQGCHVSHCTVWPIKKNS